MATRALPYQPDYAVSPGEVLEEYLEVMGMTKAQLAARCGRPTKTISEIIHGKAAITPETALQLERVLGRKAALWQNLEANYRLRRAAENEHDELSRHTGWAKKFPIRQLVEAGDIDEPKDDVDLVKKLLRFFGVGTVAGWKGSFGDLQLAFRRSASFRAAPESLTAWVRRGEIAAAAVECAPFEAKRFKKTLRSVRDLTAQSFPHVFEELQGQCASAGVAVVLVPELPKTHLSGIARWVSKEKALIQLSLRYKTSDHVWFSFFHEAAHIVLHAKKLIYIDEKGGDNHVVEDEANRFAGDLLLEPAAYERFVSARDFTAASVVEFARKQKTAPGIVVGRLQHEERIPYAMHNGLKERLVWSS